MSISQKEKAELFRRQHTDKKLLVLPNIWDRLSAKLISALGFPSLATASIGMAIANGYRDGEFIPYDKLTALVTGITEATDLPVSVDLERGFSENIPTLKDNIKKLLDTGAIGLNIEDGIDHGKQITPITEQCLKIEAIREVGIEYGVPLVINARTDFYFQPVGADTIEKVIERANAYHSAGADCFYPILINDYTAISKLTAAVEIPVNVVLNKLVGDLKKLESLGVARVSVGPQLMMAAIARMKTTAEGLLDYRSDEFFNEPSVSFEFLGKLV